MALEIVLLKSIFSPALRLPHLVCGYSFQLLASTRFSGYPQNSRYESVFLKLHFSAAFSFYAYIREALYNTDICEYSAKLTREGHHLL